MSRRTAEASKAILAAWEKEKELVKNGKGTRDWSQEQQRDILIKGKAYDENGFAFQGQHMRSVEKYPEYQGDPANIQFLTRCEHLEAHDGNWQNPTNWYFNPVTKEKLNFGEGPIIPCKIIQLTKIINCNNNGLENKKHREKEFKGSKNKEKYTKKVALGKVKISDVWNLKVKPFLRESYNFAYDFCKDNPKLVIAAVVAGGKLFINHMNSSNSYDDLSHYFTENEFSSFLFFGFLFF